MVAIVSDDRSGDPLHERCDKSDVYEGEVAQVDMVPELVGRFDGVIYGVFSGVGNLTVKLLMAAICVVASKQCANIFQNLFFSLRDLFAVPSNVEHG